MLQRMTNIDSASAAIGRNVGWIRKRHRIRQDEVAERARLYGLEWSRSIVAALETGRRRVLVTEFFVLPKLLEDLVGEPVTLADLVRGQHIEVAPGVEVDNDALQAALPGRPEVVASLSTDDKWWEAALGSDDPGGILDAIPTANREVAWLSGNGEAEQKAARRLDLPPGHVGLAAHALWGRSLTAERDDRVQRRLVGDEPDRTVQAVRGHVTRKLTEELDDYLRGLINRFTEED